MKMSPTGDIQRDPMVIDMPTPDATGLVARPTTDWTEKTSFFGLTALLMWAPLAFGTTEPWSLFVQRTFALGLFVLWVVRRSREKDVEVLPSPISWQVLGFVVLVSLQLLSGMTSYVYASFSECQNLIAYGALMLVAGDIFTRRRSLRRFAQALAIFGSLLALLSIVQGLSGTDRIYWLRSVDAISAAIYGPYVNHNHYAGLMEMLIPLGFASALLERGSKQLLLIFGTALMALSVGLSRSRGGMIALAVELVFVCVVIFRGHHHKRRLLSFAAVTAGIMAFVLLIGSDKISERLSETQDSYRLKIYSDSLSMAMHKPMLGYGLGTFPYVYPAYRSFHTNLFVNHAHNDYLELLIETGMIGLSLFVWMMIGVYRSGMAKIAQRDDLEGQLLTLACLSGVTGILAHNILDFNLHIPANAALFFVLCVAIAAPFKNRIKPMQWHWPDDGLNEDRLHA